MNLKFSINLTRKQKEVWELMHQKDTQYLMCRYSRQCGKTVIAECLLIEQLCKPNKYSLYVSPSFQLGRRVYKDIVTLLTDKGIITKSNGSTLTIETKFGSTLQFGSMEAYQSLRGLTVSGLLVLDECCFYPDQLPNGDEPWGNILMPITKARKPKVLAISTPNGRRGFAYDWYCKALNGVKGFKELSATIYDDELVTDEQIEQIKASIPLLSFRQEFLVEWIDGANTYFQGFEHCFSEFKYNNNERQWIGVDLSANGKDETVLTKINSSNQVEQYIINGTLDDKYRKIANIIDSTNNLQQVYIENNGIGAPIINEVLKIVKRKSIVNEWNTSNSSKNEILSDLAVKIANKDILFQLSDNQLYSQFSTFITKFSKSGKIQLQAANGCMDDMVMSLAIGLKAKTDNKGKPLPMIANGIPKNRFL